MLIITVTPTTYGIDFSHPLDEKGRRTTVCSVFQDDAGEWIGLATDSTTCSRKDSFNKSVGRKVALQRTLLANRDLFPKPVRMRIWQEYWSVCK